jgi:cysteine desulfurase
MTQRSGAYLDCNASCPARPEVVAAMAEVLAATGNASSLHGCGRRARRQIEDARAEIAALVGARPDQVILTSGGTEANNTALRGVAGPVAVCAVEHDSVLAAAPDATRLSVDGPGRLALDGLASTLEAERPALVALMHANNETGVLQPVAEAAVLCHAHGALLHCDAVQAAGKLPLDMAALGADLLALSAHKLGGPQGVGALVVGDAVGLAPLLRGGGQERRRRAGTENVAGIVGFATACRIAREEMAATMRRVQALRDELERRIREVEPRTRVLGGGAARLPNTSCLTMPGVAAATQLMALDLDGVAVSAGAACSSGRLAPSHVLAAMGIPPDEAGTAIRVSLGWATGEDEVDRFVESWQRLYARLVRPAADLVFAR